MNGQSDELSNRQELFLDKVGRRVKCIKHLRVDPCDDTPADELKPLFQKILYVAVLDTLAKSAYPSLRGNRERFVMFVGRFCGWPYHDRISSPHLLWLLDQFPDADCATLRGYVLKHMQSWIEGEIIGLDKDLEFKDLSGMWPNGYSKRIKEICGKDLTLDHLKHASLLWQLRNSLVHEARARGRGWEEERDKDPYYHSLIDMDAGRKTWELVYPVMFLEGLCNNAIANLRQFYEQSDIDPLAGFDFGSSYLAELN